MISYSESYFKLLVSISCCLLLATKVRAKKREICSSSLISTEIGMYLSDWFYPRQQIEPTKREKDYWNTIIPKVLFCVVCSARTLSNGCKSRVSPNSGNYIAKGKGVHRELESERSRRQTSDLTYRNFIQGIWPWVRLLPRPKPYSYSERLV